MSRIRFAVISKRREIARFLELEAIIIGFEVTVFDRPSSDLYSFDACAIDLDGTCRVPDRLPQHVLLIDGEELSDRISQISDVVFADSPVAMSVLHGFFLRVVRAEKSVEMLNAPDEPENRIYFCKNRENTVIFCNRYVQLSEYEIRLLERLCNSCGEPVSRDELNFLLGARGGNIADVYICRLRKKLETAEGKRLIFTVRSRGYKIIADMEW